MVYEALQAACTAQRWREKSRECVDRELEKMESDESLVALSNVKLIAYDIIGTVNEHCFTDYARNHAYDKLLEQIEQMMFSISLTDARAAISFKGVVITADCKDVTKKNNLE